MSKFTDEELHSLSEGNDWWCSICKELLAAREEIERLRSLIEDLPLNNELGDT